MPRPHVENFAPAHFPSPRSKTIIKRTFQHAQAQGSQPAPFSTPPAKVRHSCMVAVVSSAETGQSRTHARIIIKCSGHPFKPPQRSHSRRKRSRCRLSSTFVGVAKSASEPRSVVWEFPQPVGEGGPVLDQQEEEEDTAQKVFSKNSVGFIFCSLSLPINLHLAWRHQERGPRERRGNATRLRLPTDCFNCCLLCYTCEMLTNSLSLVRF